MQEKWIPVRRHSGNREYIAPWQITEQHDGDRIVKLDAARPDFNGALMQFLIGLLQVAAPPEEPDDSDWENWLIQPPSPDELRDRLSRYDYAFNLDGVGARFMQDFGGFEAKEKEDISSLLIDSPGANGIRNNADHFVKRDRVQCMCPSCAAMALFTLQLNAPAGGAGNRTSLRGGGPLTTLVILDPVGDGLEESLWRNLWLNVLNKSSYSTLTGNNNLSTDKDVFPWLAPTRVSDKSGSDTFCQDVNPLQMYWGMPRRIRIDWEDLAQGECSLCGVASDRLARYYAAKNYGVSYKGIWQHPLSPHRIRDAATGEVMPLHPQLGGFSYRHWLAWASGDEQHLPARVVSEFCDLLRMRKIKESQLRLSVFGYDMDNMKARCWYESTAPLYTIQSQYREVFTHRVNALVRAADEFSRFLRGCVKDAWFKRPGDAKGDTGYLAESFFNRTERSFYAAVHELVDELEAGGDGASVLAAWYGVLQTAAIKLFDYWVARGSVEHANPRRIAEAHKKLLNLIHSKKIKTLLLIKNEEEAA